MSFANQVKQWLSPRTAGGQLALAFVVFTVAAGASKLASENLLLQPEIVFRDYKLWLVATHLFITVVDPLNIIFGVIILITTGNWLEQRWGTRRLWFFVFGVGLASALLVLGVGLFTRTVALTPVYGAIGLVTWLWVGQGLIVGPQRLNFFGFPVNGYTFAAIGVAFPLLNSLRVGWLLHLETFIGLGLTAAYVYDYTPWALWVRFRSWQLERSLKRRSSRLQVIAGDKRNMPRDSDRFTH